VVPEILQDTEVGSPSGVLYIVKAQPTPVSAALKPEPAIETNVKDSPLAGVSVIVGVTANVPVPKPPPPPRTCTVQVPPCAVALTVKEADRAPVELIAHRGNGTPAKRFDPGAVIEHGNPRSAVPKEPAGAVTVTAPIVVGPVNGETVNVTGGPFAKPVEAVSVAAIPWTVIVYRPLETAGSTVKIPMTVPPALTEQTPAGAGAAKLGSNLIVTKPSLEAILKHGPAPVAKPEPERVTSCPLGPSTG
jgi:hypothetical protein